MFFVWVVGRSCFPTRPGGLERVGRILSVFLNTLWSVTLLDVLGVFAVFLCYFVYVLVLVVLVVCWNYFSLGGLLVGLNKAVMRSQDGDCRRLRMRGCALSECYSGGEFRPSLLEKFGH